MKLSREKLKQLVSEELEQEGFLDNLFGKKSQQPQIPHKVDVNNLRVDIENLLSGFFVKKPDQSLLNNDQLDVGNLKLNSARLSLPLIGILGSFKSLLEQIQEILKDNPASSQFSNLKIQIDQALPELQKITTNKQYMKYSLQDLISELSPDGLSKKFAQSIIQQQSARGASQEAEQDRLNAINADTAQKLRDKERSTVISPSGAWSGQMYTRSVRESKKLTHNKLRQIVKEELADILKQRIK